MTRAASAESARSRVTASLRVGSVMPLTRSATGGAFLAFLPRAQTAPELARELREQARQGLRPSTPAEAERWIALTRRQGYAHSRDFIPGISGIAAPVYDHSGAMVLALVALGYSTPFEAEFPRIRSSVLRCAKALCARLGQNGSGARTPERA